MPRGVTRGYECCRFNDLSGFFVSKAESMHGMGDYRTGPLANGTKCCIEEVGVGSMHTKYVHPSPDVVQSRQTASSRMLKQRRGQLEQQQLCSRLRRRLRLLHARQKHRPSAADISTTTTWTTATTTRARWRWPLAAPGPGPCGVTAADGSGGQSGGTGRRRQRVRGRGHPCCQAEPGCMSQGECRYWTQRAGR